MATLPGISAAPNADTLLFRQMHAAAVAAAAAKAAGDAVTYQQEKARLAGLSDAYLKAGGTQDALEALQQEVEESPLQTVAKTTRNVAIIIALGIGAYIFLPWLGRLRGK